MYTKLIEMFIHYSAESSNHDDSIQSFASAINGCTFSRIDIFYGIMAKIPPQEVCFKKVSTEQEAQIIYIQIEVVQVVL